MHTIRTELNTMLCAFTLGGLLYTILTCRGECANEYNMYCVSVGIYWNSIGYTILKFFSLFALCIVMHCTESYTL